MYQSKPLLSLLFLLLNSPWSTLSHIQQHPLTPLSPANLKTPPSIGLGLWNSKDTDAESAVKLAFDAGYTHLDSAAAYFNEDYVGRALSSKHAPSDRSKYWITSKLWNTMHRPENVPKALQQTLLDLQQDHLDLWLMHWPVAFMPDESGGRQVVDQDTSIEDTWRAMERLVSKNTTNPEPGTTRYIGVSNFSPRQLDAIFAICTVCPAAHEFETHPYLQQQEFVDWHLRHDVTVIAYSPLANTNPTYDEKYPDLPSILEDPFWKEMGERKGVTAAQAILGWGVQRGTVVIPKSVHEKYIVENLEAGKVRFSEEEMKEVAEQDKRARFNDPSKGWGVELFEGLDDGSNRF